MEFQPHLGIVGILQAFCLSDPRPMGAEGAALGASGLLGTWGRDSLKLGAVLQTCHNLYMNLSFASLSTTLYWSQESKLC